MRPKEYRIHVWDGPPFFLQQGAVVGTVFNVLRPIYLGELIGFSNARIQSEINTIDGSAEVVFNPSSISFQAKFLDYVLGTGRDKALGMGDDKVLALDSVQISSSDSTDFIDHPVDVGSFISIEVYRYNATSGRYIGKTLFWGQALDWEKSGADQTITLRNVSLGTLAGKQLAVESFFGNTDTLPDPINVNDEVDPMLKVQTSKFDGYSFLGDSVGGATTALKVLWWMIWGSRYLRIDSTLNTPIETLSNPPSDLVGAFMFFDLNQQTVAELLDESLEFLPSDWYFRVNYDDPQTRLSTDLTVYELTAYRPIVELRKTGRTHAALGSQSPLAIDYFLTIGQEIIDYDTSFSGEEHFTHQIVASKQQGKLNVIDLPNPGGRIVVEHIPEFEDTKDDMGNVIGQTITEDSTYVERIVQERPSSTAAPGTQEFRDYWLPQYRGKSRQLHPLWNRLTQFTEIDGIKPLPPGLIGGRNARGSLEDLIQGYADDNYLKHINPSYTGRLVVVDSDERKIEDYKEGDVIAVAGTDDVMKFVVGRIVAIDLDFITAELTISRVLINTERRLKAIEIDNKNN